MGHKGAKQCGVAPSNKYLEAESWCLEALDSFGKAGYGFESIDS